MQYVLAILILGLAAVYAWRAVKAVRSGVAHHSWLGGRIVKADRPIPFWLVTAFNVACIVACGWAFANLRL